MRLTAEVQAEPRLRLGEIFTCLLFFIAVPILLFILGLPRFQVGIALERQADTIHLLDLHQPPSSIAASRALAGLEAIYPQDGDALLWRGVLRQQLARTPQELSEAEQDLETALADAPVQPRSWTVLCQLRTTRNTQAGAGCLDTALAMGPYDWFEAMPRLRLGATLWPQLSPFARSALAHQFEMVWQTPLRQPLLTELASSDGGRALVKNALEGDPDRERAFNQLVIQGQFDEARRQKQQTK